MILADVAPRLARARDGWLAEQRARDLRRYHLTCDRLRLERLVAHRDLQLQRAQARGSGSYIKARRHKLEDAQRLLDNVTRRLEEL